MDHQQWTPIILTKNKPAVKTTKVVKQHINTTPNAIKMEKIYDEKNPDAEPIIKPVMIDSVFAKQMQQARVARKLTQKELANAICIPESIIKDYEQAKGVRNGNYVNKIKTFLNIVNTNK